MITAILLFLAFAFAVAILKSHLLRPLAVKLGQRGLVKLGARSPMRLVFVNRFFYPDHSATSQMLTDLCFALAARGHEVHVVASRLRYDQPDAVLAHGEVAHGVTVHRVWTSRFGRTSTAGRALDYLTFFLTTLLRLLALADSRTIVVAKTDPPMLSVIGALASWIKGAPLVNWTQDLYPELAQAVGMRIMRPALERPLMAARDWSARRAELNVAIGEHMRERLAARGISSERLAVIHNWADGDAIKPLAHGANSLRDEWGLQGKFVIGYSGNFGRVHEFETILGSAERLRERAGIVFLFVGDGPQLRGVQDKAASLGLTNVQFRPYQHREDLGRSLGACDAHLVSLRPNLEGLSLPSKFYGILAAGRPVLFVGALQGDIQRLVREAECGAVIETLDSAGLAECIGGLPEDASMVRRWGDNARSLFERRFSKSLAMWFWESELQAVDAEVVRTVRDTMTA